MPEMNLSLAIVELFIRHRDKGFVMLQKAALSLDRKLNR
jgi:hypothetical protein